MLVSSVMLYTFITRAFVHLDVIHDRNPLSFVLADGSIRNDYTVRIVNKRPFPRTFALKVEGIPSALLRSPVLNPSGAGSTMVDVGADQTREFRVTLTVPAGSGVQKAQDLRFIVTDVTGAEAAEARDHFLPGN